MPTDASANVEALREGLAACALCPRACGVDRAAGATGACRVGPTAVVASAGPHFGEEPCLVGSGGSGTIFLAGCNLECVFCQNHDISHPARLAHAGREMTPGQIADLALGLQQRGCENVNFVSPTHVAHAIAEAVVLARGRGLTVPVVWNCGGYESVETLRRLEGLVEIYMPDFKWANTAAGLKYSGVPDYPAVATASLEGMYQQLGPLALDARGVATRGVLVRHLVMPADLAGSLDVINAVARTAAGCTINVMGQYRPCYRAREFPKLLARVDPDEILALRAYAANRGLRLAD